MFLTEFNRFFLVFLFCIANVCLVPLRACVYLRPRFQSNTGNWVSDLSCICDLCLVKNHAPLADSLAQRIDNDAFCVVGIL